jgi:hypothetical protein
MAAAAATTLIIMRYAEHQAARGRGRVELATCIDVHTYL